MSGSSSTTRLNQQHALYAQRREAEHARAQSKQEVTRYYEHWDKVNARYEHWTAPEYYEKVESQLKAQQTSKQKEQALAERRQKLRTLLHAEETANARELERLEQQRHGRRQGGASETAELETLERLNQRLKAREQIKRKLNLEAKLYGKWRHGVDDDSRIFDDSKTDNEVLAKLNWVDRQIEQQMQCEREAAAAEERKLQLQQEANKAAELRKQREELRQAEIRELREMQERQLAEIRKLQAETEHLKEEEQSLVAFTGELEKEAELLTASSSALAMGSQTDHASAASTAFNLRKIKLIIRQRSELYRQQISLCISVLERLRMYATKPDAVARLLKRYQEQLELEVLTYKQIECMYESEAKHSLARCEALWREQHVARCAELQALLASERDSLSTLLAENRRQQNDLLDLRSSHLTTIEHANEKLKQLCVDAPDGDLQLESIEDAPHESINAATNGTSQPQLVDSFSNLNLYRQHETMAKGSLEDRLRNTRAMNTVTTGNAVPPRFGRKRVAWT